MNQVNETNRSMQKAKAGRDSIIVGHDYEKKTTINISFWISILVIVALGSYVAFKTDALDTLFPRDDQSTESIPNK